MSADINAHINCGGVAVNSFKQALHLFVAGAQGHNTVGVSEVKCIDVRTNLNQKVTLTKNTVDDVSCCRKRHMCLNIELAFFVHDGVRWIGGLEELNREEKRLSNVKKND